MTLNPSIADLPRRSPVEGSPPSRNNFVAEAIANKWYEQNQLTDLALAVPEAGPYRASWAGKRCDRALWYALRGEKPSDPPGQADAWRFGLGTTVHEMLQRIAADLFPGAQVEPEIDLNPIGVPGSAHADLIIDYEGKKLLVEIKSINGFGFKRSATRFKGPPEGPRTGHVLQAALAAKAAGCDGIVIAYLSLENVSPNLARDYSDTEAGRFAAEWHYTVAELEPLIATEVERINSLVKAVDASKPVPRRLVDPEFPQYTKITDPDHGLWVAVESPGSRTIVDTGDTWFCNYCDHKQKCIDDGA